MLLYLLIIFQELNEITKPNVIQNFWAWWDYESPFLPKEIHTLTAEAFEDWFRTHFATSRFVSSKTGMVKRSGAMLECLLLLAGIAAYTLEYQSKITAENRVKASADEYWMHPPVKVKRFLKGLYNAFEIWGTAVDVSRGTFNKSKSLTMQTAIDHVNDKANQMASSSLQPTSASKAVFKSAPSRPRPTPGAIDPSWADTHMDDISPVASGSRQIPNSNQPNSPRDVNPISRGPSLRLTAELTPETRQDIQSAEAIGIQDTNAIPIFSGLPAITPRAHPTRHRTTPARFKDGAVFPSSRKARSKSVIPEPAALMTADPEELPSLPKSFAVGNESTEDMAGSSKKRKGRPPRQVKGKKAKVDMPVDERKAIKSTKKRQVRSKAAAEEHVGI